MAPPAYPCENHTSHWNAVILFANNLVKSYSFKEISLHVWTELYTPFVVLLGMFKTQCLQSKATSFWDHFFFFGAEFHKYSNVHTWTRFIVLTSMFLWFASVLFTNDMKNKTSFVLNLYIKYIKEKNPWLTVKAKSIYSLVFTYTAWLNTCDDDNEDGALFSLVPFISVAIYPFSSFAKHLWWTLFWF